MALTVCDTRVRAQRAVVRQSVSARDYKGRDVGSQDLESVWFVTPFEFASVRAYVRVLVHRQGARHLTRTELEN